MTDDTTKGKHLAYASPSPKNRGEEITYCWRTAIKTSIGFAWLSHCWHLKECAQPTAIAQPAAVALAPAVAQVAAVSVWEGGVGGRPEWEGRRRTRRVEVESLGGGRGRPGAVTQWPPSPRRSGRVARVRNWRWTRVPALLARVCFPESGP